ncbi:MAG: hypothetical protein M1831_001045 [Alyxoria varia]|nr:MAG: hypothetical protein M1831_001045 [Alyxoria varia]
MSETTTELATPKYIYTSDRVDLSQPRKRQTGSPFFHHLPQDIRDRIYTFLLVSEVTIRWPSGKFHHNLAPAFLRTCRQAYDEAGPILYKRNVYDFLHPSDCAVFRATKDRNYASQVEELTFRIRDTDFAQLWHRYFQTTDPVWSFAANLPNLKNLLVVLQCSWWNARRLPEENLKDWHRIPELKQLCLTMQNVNQVHVTVMCRARIPQEHFDFLKRTYASDMDESAPTNNILYNLCETRMQSPGSKMHEIDVLLELLSPKDVPLYSDA